MGIFNAIKINLIILFIVFLNKDIFGMEPVAKKQKTEGVSENISQNKPRSKEEQKFLDQLKYWYNNPRKFASYRLAMRQILSEPVAPFFQNFRKHFYPIKCHLIRLAALSM